MWQRFTLYDLRVIGHYLGMLILMFSVVMVVPFVTGLLCGEYEPAARYLWFIGVTMVIGSALRFLRVGPVRLNSQQALVVTGLAWIVLAFIASLPLYYSGHYLTYLDALFDGVSGLTTTGAALIQDLDHLSNADNMFRFMMHLVGALGLIVVVLSFGLFGKSAGSTMYASEGRSEHVVPNIVQTSRLIAKITLVFVCLATAILMVMCLLIGMEPSRAFLHAFWLAITSFGTGGFAPMSQSVVYYHSFAIEIVLMVMMFLGSINFMLHSEIWKGRVDAFFADFEIKTMVVWLCVMACVMAATLSMSSGFSDLSTMLRRGLFMVVATFTTTGLQNVTSNQLTTIFSSGAFLMLALLMAVGGSGGSTTGGIKFNRIGIIMRSLVASVKQTLSPDSARVVVSYTHVGRRVLTDDVVRESMMVFVLYIATYGIGSIVAIAYGYDATQAVFDSVAIVSNGGLVSGVVSSGMPVGLEVLYIVIMWAGRLEFLTLFALVMGLVVSLNPKRWKRRA